MVYMIKQIHTAQSFSQGGPGSHKTNKKLKVNICSLGLFFAEDLIITGELLIIVD